MGRGSKDSGIEMGVVDDSIGLQQDKDIEAPPTDAAQDPAPSQFSRSTYLTAFGFPRFIASWTIVWYHFYGFQHFPIWRNSTWESQYPSRWGYTWVYFFYMLSGFVITYTRLTAKDPQKNKQEGYFMFIYHRLKGIYPLHLVAILLCVWNLPAPSWSDLEHLPLTIFLVHVWRWDINLEDLPFNGPSWFLSVLLAFYLLFKPLYAGITRVNRWGLYAIMVVCTLWPGCCDITSGWLGVRFLKLYPLMFVPMCILGMCVARIFVENFYNPHTRKLEIDPSKVSIVFKVGVMVSYAVVFILYFTIENSSQTGYMLVWYFVYPLWTYLIYSLAVGIDPLAQVMTHPALVWTENLAWPIYILQNPVFKAGERFAGSWMEGDPLVRNLTFTAALAVFSVFFYYMVDAPMRAYFNLGKRGRK